MRAAAFLFFFVILRNTAQYMNSLLSLSPEYNFCGRSRADRHKGALWARPFKISAKSKKAFARPQPTHRNAQSRGADGIFGRKILPGSLLRRRAFYALVFAFRCQTAAQVALGEVF